jgi:transforming growth factor-beta-induced protein
MHMKTWTRFGSASVVVALVGIAMAQPPATAGKEKVARPAQAAAPKGTGDIVDTAVAAGSFKTLAAALQAAGLVETLKGKGPFTVFAPTDEAFAKLPAGTVESLLKPENKEKLIAVLTYHVVPGKVTAKEVVKLKNAGTVNGQRVDIAVKGDQVVLDGGARVTATDIACSNGIIHIIDSVILPVQKNILEVAGEAGSFSTLAAAIEAAGLTGALSGAGPFTVFAPTDEAFAKLPQGTVEDLLKPENKEKLAAILKFHVIPGTIYAEQVVNLKDSGRTLQGQSFQIRNKDGTVSIGNKAATAGVICTDVEASNGVIHIIDTVLLPG